MIKRLLVSLAAIAFVGGIFVSWMFWPTLAGKHAQSTPSPMPGRSITVFGMAVCLPHKNPGEVQTMECATGFKTDNGTYYSLRDPTENYSLISQLAFNKHVTISGVLQPQSGSIYKSAGLIVLSSVQQ